MGLARFLPLVLVELTEEAPSSMAKSASKAAAGAGAATPGSTGAAIGDGPSSMVAQGSSPDRGREGPPGLGAAAARAPSSATPQL